MLALFIVVLIVIVLIVALLWMSRKNSSGALAVPVAGTQFPLLVIFLRHCEKDDRVCGNHEQPSAGCCASAHTAPNSCDDCNAQGYQRAQAIPASMHALLTRIAAGLPLSAVYASGYRDINPSCSRSRRMWETATPLAANYNVSLNTNYCTDQQKDAAQNILANWPGGIVAVVWEHNALPELVGWLMALSIDPTATSPTPVMSWPGNQVFDQYWIVDFHTGKPTLSQAPEMALPGDCPYVRTNNDCVAPTPVPTPM